MDDRRNFFFKALTAVAKKGSLWPLLLTVFFICSPAWAAWSMKARGGYLTSFALSNLILYLLFTKPHRSNLAFAIIGLLTVLVYESQPMWLAGLVPILLYRLAKERRLQPAISFFITLILFATTLYFYKISYLPQFRPHPYFPPEDRWWFQVIRFPELLYKSLHGNYLFLRTQAPNLFCAISAYATILFFAFILIVWFTQLILKRRNWLFIAAGSGFLLIYSYTFFYEQIEGRYLLPFTGFLVFAVQAWLSQVKKSFAYLQRLVAIVSIAGFVAVASFYSFDAPHIGKKESVQLLLHELDRKNIRHVFSLDCVLPYQIIFYSNEKVLCRMPYKPGRKPVYEQEIDNAFFMGKPTALIAFNSEYYDITMPPHKNIGEFVMAENPTIVTLKQIFQF